MRMRGIFLFALGLLGAAVFSQLPAFVPQYLQNIDGEIAGMNQALDEGGEAALPETAERRDSLVIQKARLDDAGEFVRVYELLARFDPDVAERALDEFEPAVPLNAEGAVMAGLGYVAFRGLGALFLGGLAVFGIGRRRAAAS